MGPLLGLIVLVLDIIAIIDAIKHQPDTGKKILWIVLVLLFPILGVVLYFLIGKKK